MVLELAESRSAVKRRPQWERIVAAATAGEVDVICAWKLDRAFRSVREAVNTLGELAERGVDFAAATQESIDTTTPTGRLLLHVLASVAEFERSLIAERVSAGLDRARRQGKALGRPRRAFDEAQARRLREQGKSWRVVARAVGAPARTVRERLRAVGGKTSSAATAVIASPDAGA